MAISNISLTTTPQALIPADGERAVTVIYVYNSNETDVTIDVYAVKSGDEADITNQIYGALIVNAGDTYIIDTERLLLDPEDMIYAKVQSADPDTVIATTSFTTL